MSDEKPARQSVRDKNRTKGGKRRGRPPNYLTQKQLDDPFGEAKTRPARRELTTLDIIHGVLAAKRKKFAASLAGQSDQKEVARQAKRLQRVAKRMASVVGIDRME